MSKHYAIIQPVVMATILALGFGCVMFLLGAWVIGIAVEATRSRQWVSEDVLILNDGNPVISRNTSSNGRWYSEYRDVGGKKVEGKVAQDTLSAVVLEAPDDARRYNCFPMDASYRVASYSFQQQNHSYCWYCVHDGRREGKAYFVGFDGESKRLIGYLGRNGFNEQRPKDEDCFDLDGTRLVGGLNLQPYAYSGGVYHTSNVAMMSGDRLLEINLKNQSVRTIMESPGMVSIALVRDGGGVDEEHLVYGHFLLALRTKHRVVLLDIAGKQKQSYAIPEEMQSRDFTVWPSGAGNAVFGQDRPLPHPRNEKLIWVDGSGKVLRQEEVALAGADSGADTTAIVWASCLVVPEPISHAAILFFFYPLNELAWGGAQTYAKALAKAVSLLWASALIVCVVSTILAWLCYRRQRRMALPWTWVWVAFVFLFGVPGYWGYRFHRRWPVLETCHVCGHAAPRDREQCAACGSKFAVPAPKGIEVFA
jgi:hypothetical protein